MTDAYHGLRRIFEERPLLGRIVGGGAAVLVFAGVVVGVIAGQAAPQTSSPGQLVVPAVTPTPRAHEQNARPTVGAPPHPGAGPEPAPAAHPPHAAPPLDISSTVRVHPSVGAPPPPMAAPSTSSPATTTVPDLPDLAAQAAAPTEHRVRSGETLAMVALRYGVPFEQIASDSGLANPNRLWPGQRLVIRAKPAGVDVIQPGRTLDDYARSTGRRLDELMRLNPQLVDPDRILAGGRLDV